jgi:lipoprotein-releasing system permease protein
VYKLFLCLRYLRTRWIALASVISVTLGVATLIVVNSVMGGFATEMRDRVKGLLSDLVMEGFGLGGFEHPDEVMERIRAAMGDKIEAMTPIVETPGFLILTLYGEEFTELVQVTGIDMETYGRVCKFYEYLYDKRMRDNPTFEVTADLIRAREWWKRIPLDDDDSSIGTRRPAITLAAAESSDGAVRLGRPQSPDPVTTADGQSDGATQSDEPRPQETLRHSVNPFGEGPTQEGTGHHDHSGSLLSEASPDERSERGIVIPYLLATTRYEHRDRELVRPGDQVRLALPHTSLSRVKIEARQEIFTTVGRFKSGMSEYDQSRCYVDIKDLQELRGMPDRANAIYIKLKDYRDAPEVSEKLRAMFAPPRFQIRTWEQKQGQLLSAVAVEQGILNVLLFMIIAVAGFGILAIFYMIVVEKRRDIGILKSLGASDGGVMGVFLGYGLALGIVGAGLGMVIGLAIVIYLDKIEAFLSRLTGQNLFNRDLYYFDRIPTVIDPWNIAWIVLGALFVAVGSSVLPAIRAAALRPVQTLRYE